MHRPRRPAEVGGTRSAIPCRRPILTEESSQFGEVFPVSPDQVVSALQREERPDLSSTSAGSSTVEAISWRSKIPYRRRRRWTATRTARLAHAQMCGDLRNRGRPVAPGQDGAGPFDDGPSPASSYSRRSWSKTRVSSVSPAPDRRSGPGSAHGRARGLIGIRRRRNRWRSRPGPHRACRLSPVATIGQVVGTDRPQERAAAPVGVGLGEELPSPARA